MYFNTFVQLPTSLNVWTDLRTKKHRYYDAIQSTWDFLHAWLIRVKRHFSFSNASVILVSKAEQCIIRRYLEAHKFVIPVCVAVLIGQHLYTDGFLSTQCNNFAMAGRHFLGDRCMQFDCLRQETQSWSLGLETSTWDFWLGSRYRRHRMVLETSGTIWRLVGMVILQNYY